MVRTAGPTAYKLPVTGTFYRPNLAKESVLDLSFASSPLANRIQDWQVLPVGKYGGELG
jgi:hypothetical protein